jgi:hypothetical protein
MGRLGVVLGRFIRRKCPDTRQVMCDDASLKQEHAMFTRNDLILLTFALKRAIESSGIDLVRDEYSQLLKRIEEQLK